MSQSRSQSVNKYWIPNKDIHRKVITSRLHLYLGPESTVRPYTKDGEDGFLIVTEGECLTDDQIDDICRESSEKWDQMTRERCALAGIDPAELKRPLHIPVLIPPSGKGYLHGSSSSSHGQHRYTRGSHRPPHDPRHAYWYSDPSTYHGDRL